MTRRIASGASQCGQLDSTGAEGGSVSSALVSDMGGRPLFENGLSRGSLLRRLVCRVSPQLQPLDLSFGIRDGGSGVGPGEADFERGKRYPVDDDGPHIRPPDPGVPQTCASLEGFDLKTIMVHGAPPGVSGVKENMGRCKPL
jgi:hypothetical protein